VKVKNWHSRLPIFMPLFLSEKKPFQQGLMSPFYSYVKQKKRTIDGASCNKSIYPNHSLILH
jgi:hypothetical protein